MGEFFKKNKSAIIALLIIGIIVILFLSSAFTRVSYEKISGDMSGESSLNIFINTVSDVTGNFSTSFSNIGLFLSNAKYVAIAWIVVMVVLLFKLGSKKEYANIEYGSADWCPDSEAYKVLSPNQGMILAHKKYLPVIPTPPPAKNGNILIIGGSGSGKSASFAIPNAMQLLGSYVFTDPKGELYDRTAGMFEKNGYKVHVINLAEPKCSDGYNPLSHIRGTLDVDTIVKIISKKEGGESKSNDPFWDQTSEALLKAVIYYIMLNRPQEEWSLASCLALVRLGGENDGEDLRNIFMSLPFENPARKAFETIRLGSEKTFSNILVSLAAKLEAFDSQEIVGLTSTNTIEFEDLVKEKSVLFFITPATNDTYNFLMNIFFSQMFDRLYEYADTMGGSLPRPLFLILDEFANIGRIPRFEQILSTCRSYKINISIILQSIDQLIAIYDEKVTENIMSNCSTHLFLGTNAQKTLETFSKQLGEKTITRDSVSRSTDKDSKFSGRNYSDQAMGRALMTPDELRKMGPDECIILVQAMKPIKAKKYWYYKKPGPHPRAAEAREAEINHRDIKAPKRGEFKVTNPYELTNYDDIFSKYADNNEEVEIDTFEDNKKSSDGKTDVNKSEKVQNGNGMQEVEYDLYAELDKKFMELYGSKKKND
ncbi:MAG: type IV secretory system conjugative DNA transfer family protein [Clostridia bacterium]|nr:type IV secretory system conjugative DNA transfer family protein [Clostridia bacterium]